MEAMDLYQSTLLRIIHRYLPDQIKPFAFQKFIRENHCFSFPFKFISFCGQYCTGGHWKLNHGEII